MNNYFLLQTENYDPLVQLIDQLSEKVTTNDRIISEILRDVDALKLPRYDVEDVSRDTEDGSGVHNGHSSFVPEQKEELDDIRYFLNSKYNLDEMDEPYTEITAPKTDQLSEDEQRRVVELMGDIRKLTAIKASNSSVNVQLYEVIKQYESFISEELVPQLRNDFNTTVSHQNKDFKKIMDLKMDVNDKVYAKYHLYLSYLDRLVQMFKVLGKALDRLGSDGVMDVEKKLIAINEVVSNLRGNKTN